MSQTTVLVGLGNPGDRYRLTRHNAGFMVLDHIAEKQRARWTHPSSAVHQARITLARTQLTLIKPQSFMNLSGEALRDLREREEFTGRNLLVICDDFNLPLGTLRLRRKGGDGGHNGLLSIIEYLGSTRFARLRLGIGPLPPDHDPADFVLEPFAQEEMQTFAGAVKAAEKCVQAVVDSGIEQAMARFNTRLPDPESD